MPPNQLSRLTYFTPGTWRICSSYDSGREKINEIAFLVTRRVAEEAATPAYHVLITVLKRPKAIIAIVMPAIVSQVRSLWRKAFLKMSFRMNIQNTFFQMLYYMGLFSSARVMSYHDNSLARLGIKAFH